MSGVSFPTYTPEQEERITALLETWGRNVRCLRPTDDREQAISFAYGNLRIDNPDVNRDDIEKAYDSLVQNKRQALLQSAEFKLTDTATKKLDVAINTLPHAKLVAQARLAKTLLKHIIESSETLPMDVVAALKEYIGN